MNPPLLHADGLGHRFGGVEALRGVSFTVERGEVVGLIGPNGSGKTTLVNCLSGFVKPDAGRVLLAGRNVTRLPPHRIANLGLVRTFQVMRPFTGLRTFENLVVALSSPRARRGRGDRHWGSGGSGSGHQGERDTVALDLLEEIGFERDSPLPFQRAGTLSTGYLKRLELARGLALRPEVVLCDELFSGLSSSETGSLVEFVRTLRERGMTFVMVEHRLRELFAVADRLLVLASGRLIAAGKPREVLDDPAVRAAYLGKADPS
jgi:branched-chain amino acid transport system ATP-binding protein